MCKETQDLYRRKLLYGHRVPSIVNIGSFPTSGKIENAAVFIFITVFGVHFS